MLCFDCKATCGDGVKCASCSKDKCFSCANITERGFRNLGSERRAAWTCPKCRIASPHPSAQKKGPTLEDILNRLDILTTKLDVLPKLISDVNELKMNMQEVIKSCEFPSRKIEDFELKLVGVNDRLSSLEETSEVANCTQSVVDALQQELNEKEQWSRLNNVEIKGIPTKNNENLFDIVDALGKHLTLPIPKTQINFISRVPVYNSKDKSILLRFVNRYAKEDFIAAARLKKQSLKASDIGFASDERLYVNDHLSPGNKKLLSKTKLVAREKNYQYVWVKHAKIHVRRNDTSPVITIKCEMDLNKLK
ncbi:unnamed protein product [Plutella xylostella]|uniref:(diamondback moth) hypothetical protein n=1 Tax=Plutella xylostella TaxID=51655 RepID=A0A8S4GCJ6_PLUXY|nr:unnamed protein product [Plutella xylostella]